MKTLSKVGITLATVSMTIGLMATPASALADTSWGGCCNVVSKR